jgi:hypothetical protein
LDESGKPIVESAPVKEPEPEEPSKEESPTWYQYTNF